MKKLLHCLIIIFFTLTSHGLQAAASPDIYLREKSHTDQVSVLGQILIPEEDITIESWISDDRVRQDAYDPLGNPLNSTIIRLDQGKIFLIDHTSRTYSDMDYPLPVNMDSQLPIDINSLLEQMTLEVTPTSKTKMIDSWSCTKYDVRIETIDIQGQSIVITQEIWTTNDIKINQELFKNPTLDNQPNVLISSPTQNAITSQWNKIKGYPVLTITTTTLTTHMMGNKLDITMTYTNELIEITEGVPPEGIYEIPKGYTKTS